MQSPENKEIAIPLKKKVLRVALAVLLLVAAGGALAGWQLYRMMFGPGVHVTERTEVRLVPEGTTYAALFDRLTADSCLSYPRVFDWMAGKMQYKDRVRPGRYVLENGMSNRSLLSMLRAGEQTPVNVMFLPVRKPELLAGVVSHQICCDSAELVTLLRDAAYLEPFGVSPQTALTLFIPNTYQMLWTTTADGFVRRMKREYDRFWNADRETAREALGMTRTEVGILASIVEEETQRSDDRRMVARVYLNRLARHMPLQADPTVRYALGDFTIRRVLTEHLSIQSPYNTYVVSGLPAGPICIPSADALDAVLHAPAHNYLYFCTAPDFVNLNFARTLQEHNRNAAAYQRELNRRRIWK